MVSWFIFMVWVGGISPVYAKHIGNGDGRLDAGLSAIVWPAGAGRKIALKYYMDW